MDSLNTAIKTIGPQWRYVDHISSGFKHLIPNNESENEGLLGMYLGLFLTLVYEDYINNNEETENRIYEKSLESGVIKEEDGLYYVGKPGDDSSKYSTFKDAMTPIRNKLAHGVFTIQNGEIAYNNHGDIGTININDLTKLVDESYKIISECAEKDPSDKKFNIIKGLYLNIKYIKHLCSSNECSIKDYIKSDLDTLKDFKNNISDIIISNYIAEFYCNYHYPLERILDSVDEEDIFINKLNPFDFKTLDVERFYTDSMKGRQKTDKEKELEGKIEYFKTHIDNFYKTNGTDIDKLPAKKLNGLNHLLENKRKFEEELKEHLEELESKEEKDRETYENNKTVIYSLRHAIAHGRVWVSKYDDDIKECIITFVDYHEGEIKYQIDIRLIDFINLFKRENKHEVSNYLYSKHTRKVARRILHI